MAKPWACLAPEGLGGRCEGALARNRPALRRYEFSLVCQDGSSKDYYPERYTGGLDNGGVHWNSGIANLAFYLLSQGGSHPRGKTSVVVPSIGILSAERIFYRALASYMGASTNFAFARDNTMQAAADLFGGCSNQYSATQKAWDAVGAPRSGGRDYEPNDFKVIGKNGAFSSNSYGLSVSQ